MRKGKATEGLVQHQVDVNAALGIILKLQNQSLQKLLLYFLKNPDSSLFTF
ncbi:hypothetical protein [Elizabethkingia miricola]|uniref:hypothetical protein n=1 Tax=Elizabethkingia miricola TaxID=172045 RepID=UPI001594767C|nr:hypothetical protein [Elizabethkingia miricola]